MRPANRVDKEKRAIARPRRCKICRRLGPPRRRDWRGRCSTCAAYLRRTGQERPFIVDGRREVKGQRVLPFARGRQTT